MNDMGSDAVTCRLKVKNEAIGRQLEEIIESLPGFRIQKSSGSDPCDVLIIEVGQKASEDLDFARTALESKAAQNIYFTSPAQDPQILLEALNLGVKGFFRQPIDRNEVKNALEKVRDQVESLRPAQAARKGRVITVTGAKGGVGTTTVAVNLATSMLELDSVNSVALIDTNQLFGDIPLFLNIERPVDWAEIARNITRLDATYLMSILYKHSSGLYVLPAPATLMDDENIPRAIEVLIRLMRSLFDYIVVDNGNRLDATSRAVLKASDRTIIVTVLTLPCLINVRRFQEVFRRLGFPLEERVDVVVNRFVKKSTISVEEAEETLNKKILWSVPNDYRITMSAINQGKPLSAMDHGAETTVKMRGLAGVLIGRAEKKRERRGLFGLK
jgi:pilus assembly protein CpaE